MEGAKNPLTAIVEDFLRHIEGGSGGTPEEFLKARGATPDPETIEVLSLLAQSRARPGSGDAIGPYRLERELGRGAQGVVYLATDTRLGRKVALKVLAPHVGFGTEIQGLVDAAGIVETIGAVRRFRREVEIAARLDHPGICPVYEAGVAGSTSFIAMRYVEGRTLADRIGEARGNHPPSSGRVRSSVVRLPEPNPESSGAGDAAVARTDFDRCCLLIERAARALHAAHEQGLIHRDIKPGNLMVTQTGAPVILDFGLARDVESANLTRTGTLLGTPVYMSPEQIATKELDRRTDVYSLGVVLFECLALRRPFDAPTLQALCHDILTREPPRLRKLNPTVPPELAVVVETALAKERERRYRTAMDLAEDLRRVRERLPIRARPPGPLLRLRRWAERSPALAASVAGILVLLVTGLAVTTQLLRRTSHALVETKRERDAKDVALRRTRALALASASAAQLEADPMLALLLAREAARADLLPEVVSRLHDAVNRSTAVAILNAKGVSRGVAFSPDGRLLLASGGRVARTWDMDWRQVGVFEGHGSEISSAAFSPDGDRILTSSVDRTARVWDLSGRTLAILRHDDVVESAAFSPDGRMVVTAGADAAVRLWTVGGELLRTLGRHESIVNCAQFSPDGTLVVTATAKGVLRLLDLDGQELGAWERGRLHWAVFSHDGKRILSLGERSAVLDLDGNVLVRLPNERLRGWFSADDSRILVADGWGLRAVVLSAAGEELAVMRGHTAWVADAAFAPDGRRVATASGDGSVRIWDPERGESTVFRGQGGLHNATFSRDGTRVATASVDGTACVLRLDGSLEICLRHEAPVHSAEISPSGDLILTGCADGVVRLWNRDGSLIRKLEGHKPCPCVGVFSPDGRLIATAAEDGNARLWDSEGRLLTTFHHPHPWVKYVGFSSDGQRLLTTCRDDRIRVWSLDGKIVRVLVHSEFPKCVAASPSDDYLVTTASEEARLWRADGTLLAVCRCLKEWSIRAAFSPDGSRLVTSYDRGAARLWSLDGKELAVLRGHAGVVNAVSFSPDGRFVLTAATDGTARLWFANTDDLIRVADERILRDFSREERLRLVDLLGPDNRQVLAAHDLVEALHAELLLGEDVARRLRSDAALDDAVRAHALRLAEELRDDPAILSQRAWDIVRYPDGDNALALRWAERALELRSESALTLLALGAALYRTGEHARAIEILERLRAAGGHEVEAFAFLALACAKAGRDTEARAHLEEALRLGASRRPTIAQPRILAEATAGVPIR